jgi:hypothetical protein
VRLPFFLFAPEFGFTFYLRAVQPELPRYPNPEYTPPIPIRRDHGRAGLPNPVLQTPSPEASSLPSDEVELGFKTLRVHSQQTTAPVINFQRLLELMAPSILQDDTSFTTWITPSNRTAATACSTPTTPRTLDHCPSAQAPYAARTGQGSVAAIDPTRSSSLCS